MLDNIQYRLPEDAQVWADLRIQLTEQQAIAQVEQMLAQMPIENIARWTKLVEKARNNNQQAIAEIYNLLDTHFSANL